MNKLYEEYNFLKYVTAFMWFVYLYKILSQNRMMVNINNVLYIYQWIKVQLATIQPCKNLYLLDEIKILIRKEMTIVILTEKIYLSNQANLIYCNSYLFNK